MKKNHISALALAVVMLLMLCACGSKEPNPTPDPTPTESMNVIVVSPDAEPAESTNVVVASPEAEPTESANVIAPEESEAVVEPLASQAPAATPEPTETPVQTQPIITPEPTPEPTPEAKALTAAEVYDKVSAVATDTLMTDCSFALDAFYPDLSEDDFEDLVLYMPDMSAKIEEILIGKVASGRIEAVKAACESRQQGMKEEAEFYTATGDYVDGYKLVVNGDWIMFVVVQHPAEAESAFNDCTK